MTNSVDRSITEKTATSYTNTFISDLMHSNGKFLTLEEFQNKFEICIIFNFIAAIPPDLKRKAFDSPSLLCRSSVIEK